VAPRTIGREVSRPPCLEPEARKKKNTSVWRPKLRPSFRPNKEKGITINHLDDLKMSKYSEEEREQIVVEYFGPGSPKENPRCPSCGEVLQLQSEYPSGASVFRLSIRCPDCQAEDVWQQGSPQTAWTKLQLAYCRERYSKGEAPRCPVDDCYVICAEYNNGIVDYRCPYCNRSGRAKR